VSPQVLDLIRLGVETLGPLFLKLVIAIFDGEDPVDVLAKERVADILPETLLSEQVLNAKVVAGELALADLRGRHAEARRRDA
jgi:hypothetical protein